MRMRSSGPGGPLRQVGDLRPHRGQRGNVFLGSIGRRPVVAHLWWATGKHVASDRALPRRVYPLPPIAEPFNRLKIVPMQRLLFVMTRCGGFPPMTIRSLPVTLRPQTRCHAGLFAKTQR